MALGLTIEEQIARLRADLRMGVPVIIVQDGRFYVIAAVESLDESRLADIRSLADKQGETMQLAITARRAKTLHARAYDGDLARLIVPRDATLRWLRSVADPSDDLSTPMKGPFESLRNGMAEIHRAALALCKQSRLLPTALILPLQDPDLPELHMIPLAELTPHLTHSSPLSRVASANVPLQVSKAGRVHVFRPADGGEEHYAIEIGKPLRDTPVLSRLHSACFTCDLIGSLKCDCGPQLRAALRQIGAEGQGVLLYLNQEGRGIGLANKMRAYSLQDQGFDTVEANHRLGFEDDERDFRIGAEILRALGFSAIRLMTNNPRKVEMMNAEGIEVVERVPLAVGKNPLNSDYLKTKATKSGHLL
jgi:GTP cyclohydrolase II